MRLKEIFVVTRGTKVILAITLSVSLAAITFAFFYYRSLNRSEDPRLSQVRKYLSDFEKLNKIPGNPFALRCLDSAYLILRSLPDYTDSFETGLIHNNKCSAILLEAIYDSTLNRSVRENLLLLAMRYCDSSIMVYRKWINEWTDLKDADIEQRVQSYMLRDDPAFRGYNYEKLIRRRIRNLMDAVIETPRRLSVSYTNRATIYRHLMIPDSSLIYYRKALELWSENRVAESNLGVLMGGQPLKPSLIKSLFPPERLKD